MNKKKILIILLIVLIIIFGIIMIREIMINSEGKLDKSNPMNREEVISLLQKGKTYSNYYYCSNISATELKTEYYIKDNVIVCYIDGALKSWTDLNNRETMHIWDMGKEKPVVTITSNINEGEYSQAGFDYSLIADTENYDFEYLGEKMQNDRNIIVFSVSYKGTKSDTRFYIDKETGLVVGRKDITKALFVSMYIGNCDRNVRLDVVTDEDVKKPDLNNYEVQNYN